ncbi:class I SAM-dependent methyltransferase [Solimicrobium silvestre]|uniref:Methyltransferase domain n=1 Tax=Solimicrobium silvestre TaxID=2099400 RepID=A0A2S9GTP7_9BURK|nr:class I SAM-dependent methyltransferase [Solimicrobium silvestre]PRC91085.1 Methyltransferase domain [Solimicrobium silvestre]
MEEKNNQNCNIDLDAWLKQPSGIYVRAWEQTVLDKLTADIFGFNAVQIGLPQIDCLAASRMPNKWLANDTLLPNSPNKIALLHDFEDLPFDTQSLDLIVLPHVLEFAAEPHQILREVERVLIPEGRLIICGFNGASLWGARQTVGRFSGRYFLPKSAEFISLLRLKDWLKLLNMEVDRGHFGCYAPPLDNQKWLQRFHFMEPAGERWWPYLGAAYIVQAIKRVKGMHLIGPAWKNKRLLVPNAVPVTNRHHSDQLDIPSKLIK